MPVVRISDIANQVLDIFLEENKDVLPDSKSRQASESTLECIFPKLSGAAQSKLLQKYPQLARYKK